MKYSITDGVARVPVEGPLTEKPSRALSLFGGGRQTSYAELRATLSTLEHDPRVKSAEFDFDTPGGEFGGLVETMRAIRAFSKPTVARIKNAHAAGFGLAASMDRRVAESDFASVGSVGAAASFYVSDSVVTIRSTASPQKNPDPRTDAGKAQLQEHIDQIYGFFAAELAKGLPQLHGNYGQGKVLYAAKALAAGLVDSIADGHEGKAKPFGASESVGVPAIGAATSTRDEQFLEAFGREIGKTFAPSEPVDGTQTTPLDQPVSTQDKSVTGSAQDEQFVCAFAREIGKPVDIPETFAASDPARDEQFIALFAKEVGGGSKSRDSQTAEPDPSRDAEFTQLFRREIEK